ncbi:hypothetical protein OROGR_015265 [Orobanche gracilis]
MSDANKDVKFSLKVVINKQKTKVLFAEAGSDFTDVLLSFLTLPLGKIVRLLEQHHKDDRPVVGSLSSLYNGLSNLDRTHFTNVLLSFLALPLGKIVRVLEQHYKDDAPVIGSLTSLYNGLSNLDSTHFSTEGAKQMLLDPISSFGDECRKLKLDISDTQPTKYFICRIWCGWNRSQKNIGMYYGTAKCICGGQLDMEIPVRNVFQSVGGDGGVFTTTSHETFLISDDLEILPNVTASFSQILSNLGITDIDGAEVRSVTFGINEILDLLKGSFLSWAPLTNIVLKNNTVSDSVAPKSEPGISLLHHQTKKEETANSTTLILKVIVQKSTRKLLFAEAEENFVDFLFSLLTIPLGGVEHLLDSSTSLKNIDNLYQSIACSNVDKYLRVAEKIRLLKPTLPHGYLSENRFFGLIEERAPELEYIVKQDSYLIPSRKTNSMFKSPKGDQYYVKGRRIYMVKDNLTVAPLSTILYFSTLNEQEVPVSDVGELVLHIGIEEALSILKASLSSSCALSNGLNHMLKRQPKQEH